ELLADSVSNGFRDSLFSQYFFFQAEDGIRVGHVTGVQTCALPISSRPRQSSTRAVILSQAAGLTISCARRDLRSSQSQRLRRTLPAKLTVISAGEAAIPPV